MRFLKHALFAYHKPAPKDNDAREELLVRYLYRAMQEDQYTDAYSVMGVESVQGDGSG